MAQLHAVFLINFVQHRAYVLFMLTPAKYNQRWALGSRHIKVMLTSFWFKIIHQLAVNELAHRYYPIAFLVYTAFVPACHLKGVSLIPRQ